MSRVFGGRLLFIAAGLVAGCCVASAVQVGARLIVDGSVISTDVRVVGGRVYVPLADAARALGMSVERRAGDYRLTRTGGGNQLLCATGKIATDIHSGPWLLRVVSSERVGTYQPRFGSDRAALAPTESGDTLYVVRCTLRNATNRTRDVRFDHDAPGNTAITDDRSHGYVPMAFDLRNGDDYTVKILPGAAHDFAVVFSVPGSATVKDLIYTVLSSTASDQAEETSTDFRVLLGP